MECVQKQQSTVRVEMPTLIRIKITAASKQIDIYDKESAEFRRNLASEEAMRLLESRKSLRAATVSRMAFIR
jgi:hypothetical protein